MVIEVVPSEDDEVSEVMPAMVDNCRSIGEATEAAMVSALAPGSVAVMRWWESRPPAAPPPRAAGSAKIPNTMIDGGDQRREHRTANAGFGEAHALRTLPSRSRTATFVPFESSS